MCPFKHKNVDQQQRKAFFTCWQPYLDRLTQGENTFVMRNYHSPNILWRTQKEGFARIGLIDFQDGLIGRTAYDLVSLAQDARVFISPTREAKFSTPIAMHVTKHHDLSRKVNFVNFTHLQAPNALRKF